MAMGLAARDDLELALLENLSEVENDNEQNLSCYPCSKGARAR